MMLVCRVLVVIIEQATRFENKCKKPSNTGVEFAVRELAALYSLDNSIGIESAAGRHFKIEPCFNTLDTLICGTPISHDDAIETPLIPQYFC